MIVPIKIQQTSLSEKLVNHGKSSINQWIGLREKLQETSIFHDFHGKIHGFPVKKCIESMG